MSWVNDDLESNEEGTLGNAGSETTGTRVSFPPIFPSTPSVVFL